MSNYHNEAALFEHTYQIKCAQIRGLEETIKDQSDELTKTKLELGTMRILCDRLSGVDLTEDMARAFAECFSGDYDTMQDGAKQSTVQLMQAYSATIFDAACAGLFNVTRQEHHGQDESGKYTRQVIRLERLPAENDGGKS